MQAQQVTPTAALHPPAPLVLYHANCADGFCAALLFHLSIPDAELVAVSYGQPLPDCTDREVFFLDFHVSREKLTQICDVARSVVLLDHHKTAFENLVDTNFKHEKAIVWVYLDRSGARLAWDYLHTENLLPDSLRTLYNFNPPLLVHYVEDRDLWLWKLPRSKAINAYLRSLPQDFKTWERALYWDADDWLLMAEYGDAILRAQQQTIEAHVKFAQDVELCGYRGRAVAATSLNSEIAGELASGVDFGACYVVTLDGRQRWSLRSRKEGGVNVEKIAKQFNGGGHEHAAGFSIHSNEWKENGLLSIGAPVVFERVE